MIKISGGKLVAREREEEGGGGRETRKKNLTNRKMEPKCRAEEAFTFDDKFGKVGDTGAFGGLGDAAVQVLVRSLDGIELEGNHEAPVAQVFDGRGR